MSALYEALESLHPRDFSEIPTDDIPKLLSEAFSAAELIVNSVPHPQLPKDGTESPSPAKMATCAAEMTASPARHPPVHPEHEELQKNWGKPLKLSAKDNTLGLSLYKMAANDRHGAWFARRSVHEGLPFDRWKGAMQKEFAESLAVTGGPGSGSIRGIGADRVLERKIFDSGKMEVWQLSAQFPGPTAARDFIVLLLTTDNGLGEKSATHHGERKIDSQVQRHYMVVSIPIEHPDAPVRDGHVRGQYESVEMIREIPAMVSQQPSASDLLKVPAGIVGKAGNSAATSTTTLGSDATGEQTHSSAGDSQELYKANPVEWIMITRSDPGGGIPRFMVERGTPSSIAGDAVKFLNWATDKDEDFLATDGEQSGIGSLKSSKLEIPPINRRLSDSSTFEPSKPTDTGIISSLTNVAKSYVPTSVQQGLSNLLTGTEEPPEADDGEDTSSVDSFASAEQFTTAPDAIPDHLKSPAENASDTSSLNSSADTPNAKLDKQLTKLENRRKELDAKFAKEKEREKAKAEGKISKDEKEGEKIRKRLERDMKKQEEKHARELKKLEEKQKTEEKKADERRKKATEADALTKVKRELGQTKRVAEVLRLENKVWQERVGELQRENTKLVSRVSKLNGGQDLLKEVNREMAEEGSGSGKMRSSSPSSSKSARDTES